MKAAKPKGITEPDHNGKNPKNGGG